MFFRNLTFFRFPVSLSSALSELDPRLEDCRLKPVGPSEAEVARNSRSRSARLRSAVRTAAPAWQRQTGERK